MPNSPLTPEATVIVLNWNGRDLFRETIDALLAQSIADRLKIVIVDQDSTDGSRQEIDSVYGSRITLVRAPRNLGFTGGNNLGFRHAEGRWVLLLNMDAVPGTNWAEEMIRAAGADPAVGMATPKIVSYGRPEIIDNAGMLTWPDGLNRSRGNLETDRGQYDEPCETLFASGCAALYRLDCIRTMGGFDETFFIYGDDADLGLKLRRAGWSCRYVPTAVVRHHGSFTFRNMTLRKLALIERNRIFVLVKYFPLGWVLISPWYTLKRLWAAWWAGRDGKGVAGAIAGTFSAPSLILTFAGAWLSSLWHLPGMLVGRVRLRRFRRLSDRDFAALLRRFAAPLRAISFAAPEGAPRPQRTGE